MKNRLIFTAVAALAALSIAEPLMGQRPTADEEPTAIIESCVVRGPGVLYRSGVEGAPADCRGRHESITWNAYVDLGTLQMRIDGACAEGSSISAVNPDGSVTCASDHDSAAGVDFASFQPRVTAECPEGSSINSIAGDGTVTCLPDEAGDLSPYQTRVAGNCAEGSSIRAIASDGSVECHPDAYTAVSYTSEFALARHDDGTAGDIGLGPAEARICFLTRVGFEDLDSEDEKGECRVYRDGGSWRLRADLDNTDDANGWCSARCLTWSAAQ